jgi:putative transposase
MDKNGLPFVPSERRPRRENAMPRLARAVLPHALHHITQRGVRRFQVFLEDADYRRYLELLREYAQRFGLGIASYCVMPNHIHIIGEPERGDSIAKTLQYCHGMYAAEFNKKYQKFGHVWQARPFSCVLDEPHAWAAVRYVERNPVRAGLVLKAEDYPWSSARAHCQLVNDPLLTSSLPGENLVKDWRLWLSTGASVDQETQIRNRTHTGRPCGDDSFIRTVEASLGRNLAPAKRGRRRQEKEVPQIPLLPTDLD